MNVHTSRALALTALCALPLTLAGPASTSVPRQDGGEEAMGGMMAMAAKYITPGENHEVLERFLGTWDTELRFMMGGTATQPSKGKTETKWLHDGRWIQTQWSIPMMGMPVQGTSIMGYDNFKKSFVATTVSTMDTAMNHTEGDLNKKGDVLLLYGTVDEYLDGQHDKMSKTVYRFLSADEIVMEVHDFTIGEENTQVLEIRMKRAK